MKLLTSTCGFPVRADSLRVGFFFSHLVVFAAFSPLKIVQLLSHIFYNKRRLREARSSAQCHQLGMAAGSSNLDSISQTFTLLPLNVSILNFLSWDARFSFLLVDPHSFKTHLIIASSRKPALICCLTGVPLAASTLRGDCFGHRAMEPGGARPL